MFFIVFLWVVSSFTNVSCSNSFKTFTDVAVSLELLSGNLQYLKESQPKGTLHKELKVLSSAVGKFNKAFFIEKLMVFHCGYYDGLDEFYGEALRTYQQLRRNPWSSSIHKALDMTVFSKDYGSPSEALRKTEFREELRLLLNEGKIPFKPNDSRPYHIGLKRALFRYAFQEVRGLLETKIEESTGERILYKDIKTKLWSNYCFPAVIKTINQVKDIYNELPNMVFRLK